MPAESTPKSGSLRAAAASAIVPGLGQWLSGRRRAALFSALPLIAVAAVTLGALLFFGVVRTAAAIATPGRLTILFALLLLSIPWRVLVTVDAARGTRRTRRSAILLALALLISIAPQAGAAAIVYRAKVAATDVFSGFTTPTPDSSAAESTTPTPPPLGDRFTMLLIGADTMGNRSSFNTDSMIIVSWDRIGGYVSTVSIPRDLVNVPLGNGEVYGPKINSLWSHALRYPKRFPGGPAAALSTALGTMFNVKIDATAVVVIPTFVKIIDQLGGVDLTIRRTIVDVSYRTNMDGARLPAGNWHMSGECALAYARIRKAPGTDDMTRGPRQIEILLAARDELARSGNFVGNALALLDVIGDGVRTDLNPALIPQLAEAAGSFDTSKIVRAVIQPGDTILRYRHKGEYSPFGSVVFFDAARMSLLAARLFPAPGTRPWGFPATKSEPKLGAEATFTPAPLASGASPTPTATPTPALTHPFPTLASCDAGLPRPRYTPTPDPTAPPESTSPSPSPTEPTPLPGVPESVPPAP
ncbi:LytR family transcriptional regulator [bacterium]|nr:LytR family transcriptional regulator [bacterium]